MLAVGDVAVETVALGDTTLAAVYLGDTQVWSQETPPGDPTLLAQYMLDGSGVDTSQYGRSALSVNAATGAYQSAAGRQGLAQTATGAYVSLAATPWFPASGPITYMCEAYVTDLTAGTTRQLTGFFDFDVRSLVLYAQRAGVSNPNVLHAVLGSPAQGEANLYGPALAVDTWYHVALTFDGTTVRLYLDGIEVATANRAGVPLPTGVDRMCTHHWQNGTVTGNSFATVRAIRFYSRALSHAEIAALAGG